MAAVGTVKVQVSIASRCPVCEGRGHVANGFYTSSPGLPWSTSSTVPVPCRSCSGTGIVWPKGE